MTRKEFVTNTAVEIFFKFFKTRVVCQERTKEAVSLAISIANALENAGEADWNTKPESRIIDETKDCYR